MPPALPLLTKGSNTGKNGDQNIILWSEHGAEKEAELINVTGSIVLNYVVVFKIPCVVHTQHCLIIQTFKLRGFKTHRTACAKNARHLDEDLLHVANTQCSATVNVQANAHRSNQANNQPEDQVHNSQIFKELNSMDVDEWMDIDDYQDVSYSIHGMIPPDESEQHETAFNMDDIQTEFHPNSETLMQIRTFSKFQRTISQDPPTPNKRPWEPFRSRLDFEVPYDGVAHEFTVHYRDLWDWASDLLRDPYIGPQFTFDAQRLSKFDGQKFMRFIDEPWTADVFWDAQSAMPADGKPLAFILYTDKAKLSSFGHAKEIPESHDLLDNAEDDVDVMPHDTLGMFQSLKSYDTFNYSDCSNLLYLLVKDDPAKSGKQKFANFKAAVWHESLRTMLKCLRSKRKHDYEEQCVMSLIHGVMGKFPCPICLVPQDELFDLLKTWPLRTLHGAIHLLRKARKKPTKAKREQKLKSQSLRDVDNALLKSKLVDVFCALSFDHLHTNHEGLEGKHLWNELQKLINDIGQGAASKIDEGFAAAPRWRNLNHFKEVMGISFTDGTKYEDLLKLIPFIAHEVLDHGSHELGYLLLQSLEVHTMETLAAGRAALDEFARTYILKSESEPKNWNFPKIHLATHLFDDIMAKGVTCNFNTKPNEKAHRPLKKSYQLRTNFKDVAEQANHWSLVSASVRYRLNDLDDYSVRNKEVGMLDESDLDSDDPSFHIKLGSRQRTLSIHAIQQAHIEDKAFNNFHMKLTHFCNTIPAITQSGNIALEFIANIQRGADRSKNIVF
ncbi:hypothetical protein EV424DRAFT_1589978 [Suillus variegatus]|nr:hypothetical protein EV424DRAFT_1589978 [Suillus variegatus]